MGCLLFFGVKGQKRYTFFTFNFFKKSINEPNQVTTLYTFSKIQKISHSAFTQQKLNIFIKKVSRFR